MRAVPARAALMRPSLTWGSRCRLHPRGLNPELYTLDTKPLTGQSASFASLWPSQPQTPPGCHCPFSSPTLPPLCWRPRIGPRSRPACCALRTVTLNPARVQTQLTILGRAASLSPRARARSVSPSRPQPPWPHATMCSWRARSSAPHSRTERLASSNTKGRAKVEAGPQLLGGETGQPASPRRRGSARAQAAAHHAMWQLPTWARSAAGAAWARAPARAPKPRSSRLPSAPGPQPPAPAPRPAARPRRSATG